MKIEVLTIFPEIFSGWISSSLISKAIEKELLRISFSNIRDFASPPHYQVDDTPYGGGAGMVMKVEPLALAIEAAKQKLPQAKVIYLSPAGKRLSQPTCAELSKEQELIIICGRYEGIDQRVIDLFVDEEISLGDYVIMGGEVASMVLIEAAIRLVDGVLGNQESAQHESFSDPQAPDRIEAPQYTRPPEFRGSKVPEILLSGNHAAISNYRLQQSELKKKS